MRNLFVLMGVPGSGKSTFAEALLDIRSNIEHVSSDEIRKEFFEYKDNHKEIFKIMHQRTLECLKNGKDVIYDSTNLERKYRLELYKKAKKQDSNTRVITVFIHKGLERAIKQSKQRENRTDVNEVLIREMYETMQLPIAGTDCDTIMIPTIQMENNMFKLVDSIFYNTSENNAFNNYIKMVDPKLLQTDLEEEKSR